MPIASLAHEVARTAPRLQDRGVSRNTQAGDSLVDAGNHGRRSVKSVESRALGAVVFLRRQQRLEFFPDCLPAGVLVTSANRIGKDRQGDRPEAGEAGKCLFFLRSCVSLLLLDGLEGADGGK